MIIELEHHLEPREVWEKRGGKPGQLVVQYASDGTPLRPLERAVDEWVVQPLVDAWFANRVRVGRVRFTAAAPAQSSPRDLPDNVTEIGGARGGAGSRAASSSANPITFSQG